MRTGNVLDLHSQIVSMVSIFSKSIVIFYFSFIFLHYCNQEHQNRPGETLKCL